MRTRGRLFDILSHVRQTVCDHPFSDASSCHGCCATAVGSSPPPPPFRQPAWVRGKEWAKNWNRHPDFGPTVGCSPEHPCSQPRFSRSRFRSLLNLTAAFPHNARFAARLWTMYHSARGWHKKKKRWPGSGLRLQSRPLRRSAPSARSPSVARAIGTCKCARLADLSTMATAYRRLPAVSLWESDAAAPCFRGWTMVKPPCMPSCASLLQLTTTGH